MNFWDGLAYGFLGVLGVYVVARLITAAYFRSRSDFERMVRHGTQKPR